MRSRNVGADVVSTNDIAVGRFDVDANFGVGGDNVAFGRCGSANAVGICICHYNYAIVVAKRICACDVGAYVVARHYVVSASAAFDDYSRIGVARQYIAFAFGVSSDGIVVRCRRNVYSLIVWNRKSSSSVGADFVVCYCVVSNANEGNSSDCISRNDVVGYVDVTCISEVV